VTDEGAVVAATVGSAVGIAPAAMASAKAGPFARRRAGPSGAAGGLALPSIGEMGALARRSDLLLAIGVMGILVVLVFPLPAVLIDLLLAVSIIVSVLILMTALFIEEPLEFSSFPTVLLIATMLRLALNLAATRLILARGHEGTAAAGHVIEAFGHFVMGGNFVIGVIVFAILIIVNFVVITKGSGRIAEVAARFTLDAMPGKQMAIDADLSAGLIDEAAARARRKALEDESSFFGAMDGASKFVRGDAIAALLITFINVVGGIIIGVAQQGLSFSEAAKTYTLLTCGDGLVSQVPALIVSTAAGLLVSKAGVRGAADKALGRQLSNYPKALGMSAAVMGAIALLPGIPMLPFLALAGGAAWLARKVDRDMKARLAAAASAAAPAANASDAPKDEPIADVLKIDDLKVEVGYALVPLVNAADGNDRLTEQIKALRRQLAAEAGFVMPSVRILDNVQLDSNAYVVRVKEIEAGQGQIFPGLYMAMDPMGGQVQLPGQHMLEPTFGLPATWIDGALRDQAQLRGYTVVDAATVVTTHLTEIIKAHGRAALAYRGAEAPQGAAEGARRPRQGDRAGADLDHRHPARAAAPPRRARLDPRPRHHRRGRGGSRRHPQEPARDRRACPRAPRPPDLRRACGAGRAPADHHAVAAMGGRLPRGDRRRGRQPPPRDAALAPDRVRARRARPLRGRGPPRRDAGPRHLGAVTPLRPLDHRALPPRDLGDLAGRDPRPGTAEDGGERVRERGLEPGRRHAQPARRHSHSLIECRDRNPKSLGYRDVEGIRCPEIQVESPQESCRHHKIGGPNLCHRAEASHPFIEFREDRPGVHLGELTRAHLSGHGGCKLRSGKIPYHRSIRSCSEVRIEVRRQGIRREQCDEDAGV
jgi:flagellar biosynthesis protein FlhA